MNKEILEQLPLLEIKIETILAELLELEEVEMNEIIIYPQGLFERPYSNEVLNIEYIETQESEEILAHINVCREGLYDTLPERLFHYSKGRKRMSSMKEMIEENRKRKEESKKARQFFLPFDQEFFKARIDLEIEERRLLFSISDKFQSTIFKGEWEAELEKLSTTTKANFFFLLPKANQITGDLELTEQAFSSITGEKVSIETRPSGIVKCEDLVTPVIGEMLLGVDAVLGQQIEEGLTQWKITVDTLTLEKIPEAITWNQPGGLFEILDNFFIPFEIEAQWAVNISKTEKGFQLEEEASFSRLGYSTVL